MKIIDLLKSDFKNYQFLTSKKWFSFGEEIRFEKTKDDTTYEWLIKFDKYFKDNDYNFDLSWVISRDNHCTNANWIAKIIDMSKQFEFDYLEHEGDTLYIHLKAKRR